MQKIFCILALIAVDTALVLFIDSVGPAAFIIGKILGVTCLSFICYLIITFMGTKTGLKLPIWLKTLIAAILTSVAMLVR